MIRICGPKCARRPGAINVTSKSKTWSRGLSPFVLGPVPLYGSFQAMNVENAWQFSKVFAEHIDEEGNVSPEYWGWANKGWGKQYAIRYPMGKGARPLFSLWDSERLSYVEARKKIYIPLYSNAVRGTDAYRRLKEATESKPELWLFDFDGYDHRSLGMTLDDVVNCESRKMGHAFVLAMMLEGEI